eukprot:260200_1
MAEAQYDATHYAIQNITDDTIEIVVTETGWATSSAVNECQYANVSNAKIYIDTTLQSMNDRWSPLYGVKVFFFELLDENEKPLFECERDFGFYDMNGVAKYDMIDPAQTTHFDIFGTDFDGSHTNATTMPRTTSAIHDHKKKPDMIVVINLLLCAVS